MTAGDREAGSSFGNSVCRAANGASAIVGNYYDDNGSASGSVYIYQ